MILLFQLDMVENCLSVFERAYIIMADVIEREGKKRWNLSMHFWCAAVDKLRSRSDVIWIIAPMCWQVILAWF